MDACNLFTNTDGSIKICALKTVVISDYSTAKNISYVSVHMQITYDSKNVMANFNSEYFVQLLTHDYRFYFAV